MGISLPDDYSELINSVSNFTCPKTVGANDKSSPSMCLICGAILCSGMIQYGEYHRCYCCQSELDGTTVGACTLHAHRCGMQKISNNNRYFVKHKFYNIYSLYPSKYFFRIIYRDRLWLLFLKNYAQICIYSYYCSLFRLSSFF